MARIDPVVFTEKDADGLRPELPQFLDMRLNHRVALQPALAERQRRHVPIAVRFGEVDLQPDRFGGGDGCHDRQEQDDLLPNWQKSRFPQSFSKRWCMDWESMGVGSDISRSQSSLQQRQLTDGWSG